MRGIRCGLAAAVLTLAVAACGQQEAPSSADPGIGHVHGVGVDPSDGAVYVAAHYGLFKVTGADTAQRVAGRIADHMGFTVIGPKTFLASGHPGEADASTPPHLGLIRTADAGAIWTTVSEGGSADFHALQLAGDTLYAYDSQTGRVRSSADQGATWTQGAAEKVVDLAASAARPERLYATTQDGVRVSGDKGQKFAPVPGAPTLTHLDAPDAETLIGTDVEERIQVSTDAGATWRAPGGSLPGQASAFTAVDGKRLLAATEDGAIHQSDDGGVSFSVVFRPAAT
jgi:hypothetical protein